MAFSPFTAGLFTAGQILTAAQMNTFIRDNIMAGGPVYATEAARTADIPTPFEGQRAYITGPTVTAPTAATFATLPTGITTIYNGAAWVCTTPITAFSTVSGTTTSSGTYVTTLTGDTTPVAVTANTGTTASVLITTRASSALAARNLIVAVSVSGATTIAAPVIANGFASMESPSVNGVVMINGNLVITGLTAGANTFTLNYQTGGTTTATWTYRGLTVQGIA